MATTKLGVYYPADYSAMADIPKDMKKMAESIDGVFQSGGAAEGAMVYRGVWQAGITYYKDNVVCAQGKEEYFIALATNSSEYPSEKPKYWKPFSKNTSTTGANGKSAYEIAVENGFDGTEEEWLASLKGKDGASGKDGINGTNGIDGEDGKSAYQIWLEQGNEGTETEFLASLKGKDGTMTFEDLTEEQKATLKGDKGEAGEPGKPGNSGVYLGTEEPTDSSVNIWIDPDGTTEEFATKEYIDNAISTAITDVLGGSY